MVCVTYKSVSTNVPVIVTVGSMCTEAIRTSRHVHLFYLLSEKFLWIPVASVGCSPQGH